MTFNPPHWYYHKKVLHPKKEIDQVIKELKDFPDYETKTCQTTFYLGGNKRPENIWQQKYNEICKNIVQQLGLYNQFYYKYQLWSQLYEKGQSFFCHNHFDPSYRSYQASLSIIHFLKNTNERNLIFINKDTDEIYKPKQEEGDILIFPSYLYHGVTPNTSDSGRFVVAFNIIFDGSS